MEVSISGCLRYLDESGWTELIDKRYKDDVEKELKDKFPDITDEILNRVLDVVIW